MKFPSPKRQSGPSEDGYMLVAVIFMLAILILSLAVALPRVRESIQRDRELETMRRGKQYSRAIQLYYRKFGTYPPNVDALVKTNEIRFLRKRYIDPMTGKDDWKPIPYCQNKTPQAMGFFGQPLAGAGCGVVAGTGPGGSSAFPGSPAPGSGVGMAAGPGFGSPTGGSNSPTIGPTDSGSGSTGSTDSGSGTSSGSGTDSNGNPTTGGAAAGSGTSSTSGGSSAFGGPASSGQTMGGGGIVGFSPGSPKQSIFVYKKKNHYNEWEFLYSPLSDQQQVAGGNTGTVGQPASSTTTPVGSPTTFGPGTTGTPTAPTNPTPSPQQ